MLPLRNQACKNKGSLAQHREQQGMTLAPGTPGVVALGRAFLRSLASEDRAVEIQREPFGRLLEQGEQPAEERTKERLHKVQGYVREEAQDHIVARETLKTESVRSQSTWASREVPTMTLSKMP